MKQTFNLNLIKYVTLLRLIIIIIIVVLCVINKRGKCAFSVSGGYCSQMQIQHKENLLFASLCTNTCASHQPPPYATHIYIRIYEAIYVIVIVSLLIVSFCALLLLALCLAEPRRARITLSLYIQSEPPHSKHAPTTAYVAVYIHQRKWNKHCGDKVWFLYALLYFSLAHLNTTTLCILWWVGCGCYVVHDRAQLLTSCTPERTAAQHTHSHKHI